MRSVKGRLHLTEKQQDRFDADAATPVLRARIDAVLRSRTDYWNQAVVSADTGAKRLVTAELFGVFSAVLPGCDQGIVWRMSAETELKKPAKKPWGFVLRVAVEPDPAREETPELKKLVGEVERLTISLLQPALLPILTDETKWHRY